MSFTDLEKEALEVFVTSPTDPIYAVKNTVPPEVFGAFGSYFSRNPKDMREHLLDAITGQVEGEESEVPKEEILTSLAKGEFKDPGQAITNGLSKAQGFFKKWYGKYSHKSIANVVPLSMVGTNVSQLFAKELAYDQLAFFIEQSTRYVKWNLDNMFLDHDVMKSKHEAKFKSTIGSLAQAYHQVSESTVKFYKRKIPFTKWKEWQSETTLKSPLKQQEAKYTREINGAALDRSRFLLPQACMTNIAWILDARSTEFDIAAWKGHPLREMRTSAALIERNAGKIAPSLLKYTEKNDYYAEKLNGFGGEIRLSGTPFDKGVDIISYEKDSLNHVIAHLLKRHGRGGTLRQRLETTNRMNHDEKIEILKRVTKNRGSHDEWVAMDEDLDLVKICLEIQTDLGAIRDWRRHQKWDRGEALYTLDCGYEKPDIFLEMGGETEKLFDRSMKLAHETESEVRKDFPFQAQYVIPMAARHAITMSSGLDQLQYMLWTRSTPQANFSYRKDAFNIAEAAVRKLPWLLGYENYPQSKPFMQVYEEAPLKGFLRLQTEPSALHE